MSADDLQAWLAKRDTPIWENISKWYDRLCCEKQDLRLWMLQHKCKGLEGTRESPLFRFGRAKPDPDVFEPLNSPDKKGLFRLRRNPAGRCEREILKTIHAKWRREPLEWVVFGGLCRDDKGRAPLHKVTRFDGDCWVIVRPGKSVASMLKKRGAVKGLMSEYYKLVESNNEH